MKHGFRKNELFADYNLKMFNESQRDDLFVETGIVQNRNQKMLSIFSMPDHTHILIGMKPDISVSDLTRDIKAISSKFINDNKLVKGKFNWQVGFGAFSYSKSQIDSVIKYILNQEQHHKKKSFNEEYLDFLKKFGIEYDERYLFEWIE